MKRKKEGFLNERAIVLPGEIIKGLKNNQLTRLLYITDIGYYPHAEGHYRKREAGSHQNILIYCVDGEGWYDTGQGKCIVRKNDFFILPADMFHIYAADEHAPWSIYWLHFSGEKSELFSPIFNKTFHITDSPSARFDDRLQLFNEIFVNLEMGYGKENMEYITLCLWHFLGSFRYITQFREVNNPKPEDTVQKVINFMKNNIDKQLTLNEIADSVNYSPTYLSSLFSKKCDMAPLYYFNQLKIQRACHLLDFTDKKIKEIAYELSFSDPYYFSRVFSKYIGLSPQEYRKKKKG